MSILTNRRNLYWSFPIGIHKRQTIRHIVQLFFSELHLISENVIMSKSTCSSCHSLTLHKKVYTSFFGNCIVYNNSTVAIFNSIIFSLIKFIINSFGNNSNCHLWPIIFVNLFQLLNNFIKLTLFN